jgi:hypothetical protein
MKPGILVGLLQSDVKGSIGRVGMVCIMAGAPIAGGAMLLGGGSKKHGGHEK